MATGVMEVTLVKARGLKNTDFIFGGKIDPYVVIRYKNQEHRSTVAKGQGSTPVWNEKFTFRVQYPGPDDEHKLLLSIMDKDTLSADDFLGQSTIYLKDLFELGVENGTAVEEPTRYSVVDGDKIYNGEIQVGITFTAKVEAEDVADFGGWRESNPDFLT
ncbi:elicitor-responsive protein 1 [Heracleum sosnowskyi]|uniref:Elicitor-responsive protein 1 n=1 Tax=Heracleum sosnowskyi TaxID=360622 RepID=A0AAD8I3N0_9APIA|nr:elicitor-responsive protein 1 [Heracleum sosnowskyi]